ncbi:MAG: RDD family protein, partial [Steroidobacteraceae bacterium]
APASSSAPAAASSATDAGTADTDNDDSDNWRGFSRRWDRQVHHRHMHGDTNDLVSVGHDATLPANQTLDSVVAVFGSATNNGTAREDVVSVFGDTAVNGPVQDSAVAVLGNVSVNADVSQDVVAVLGSVTLGPNAHVHGQVVSILGTVTEDPAAVVEEGVQRILPENFATALGIRNWVGHGLMMARPLVIGAGLSWLWYISFGLLAIYTLLALLFRDATEQCITTLHEHPGKSLITAILAVLLTPLMLLLLTITVVGILVIPVAIATLICAAIFGKTTVLGWIGSRCFGMRPGQPAAHPALAVIVGGLLVMLAYMVPLLGFVLFILIGMLGYGAVLYTIINRIRHSTSGAAVPSGTAPGGTSPGVAAQPVAFAPEPAAAADATASATAGGPGLSSGATSAAPLPLSTYPRAGFWIRMGALFIDAVIIWAVIRLLLNFPQEGSNRIGIIALAVYGAIMWKVKGTTMGGIVCDLHVVRVDSRPLDWPTVCVRALGCILSICALGLGFFWIAVDGGKQAWHDKLAGTIVVRVPKGTPLV